MFQGVVTFRAIDRIADVSYKVFRYSTICRQTDVHMASKNHVNYPYQTVKLA
jgi:hypothetical protein